MDIKGSVVLVTGGAGLIGSHTVDRLLKEDVENIVVFDKVINERNLAEAMRSRRVKVIQGDIFKLQDVKAAVNGADFVFHFAAMLMLPSIKNPRKCLRDNIIGTFNLLELIGKQKVKKLIFASSIAPYGSSKEKVLMTEDYPFKNRTMYGASKIVGEQFCRIIYDMTGLKYLALRYSSAYGPRQHWEGLYPRLILHALERIDQGLPPQIEGSGDDVQNFIYVEDAAEASVLALKSDVDDEAINIASGVPTTTKELIQTLINLTRPGLEIEFLPAPENAFQPSRWVSIEKAKMLLGFAPRTDLQTGLRKLIEWRRHTR